MLGNLGTDIRSSQRAAFSDVRVLVFQGHQVVIPNLAFTSVAVNLVVPHCCSMKTVSRTRIQEWKCAILHRAQ